MLPHAELVVTGYNSTRFTTNMDYALLGLLVFSLPFAVLFILKDLVTMPWRKERI